MTCEISSFNPPSDPRDDIAQRIAVGYVLNNPEALDEFEFLNSFRFTERRDQLLIQTVRQCIDEQKTVDLLNVTQFAVLPPSLTREEFQAYAVGAFSYDPLPDSATEQIEILWSRHRNDRIKFGTEAAKIAASDGNTAQAIQILRGLVDGDSEAAKGKVRFEGIRGEDLEHAADSEPDWMIRDVFTMDEPAVIGAAMKGCKTSLLVDKAVALATGSSWLGFKIERTRKVLFVTGEANCRRIGKQLRAALRSRGMSFGDLQGNLRVEAIEFPAVTSEADLRGLSRTIRSHGIEVAIIDPWYRSIQGVDTARMNEVGSLVKRLQFAVAPAVLVLSHHITKAAARERNSALGLEDLTGAGLGEAAGQWWLSSRAEAYKPNAPHQFRVLYGGRESQGGELIVTFDEQRWEWSTTSIHEHESVRDLERAAIRAADQETKLNSHRAAITGAMRNSGPMSKSDIETASGLRQTDFRVAFAFMVKDQTVQRGTYTTSAGHVRHDGWVLRSGV